MGAQIAFVVVLVIGIAVLFWFILKTSSQRIAAQYQQLSERFGLELTIPEPKMGGFVRAEPFVHGDYRGREMSISAPGKGLQNTRQSETVLKLSLKDDALQVQITEAGLLGGMRQRDSGQKDRWMSGDRDFDAALDVRTNDGVRLAMFLDVEVQRALLGLLKGSKATIYIRKGVMAVSVLGMVADDPSREFFEQATEFLCDFAEVAES
ncbi:MAG: hypothetical protein ACPGKS_00475 [Coraliomargarita sp.]